METFLVVTQKINNLILNMKKKKFLILLPILIVGIFLYFQYQQYSKLPDFNNVTYQPVNGADDIPINWRFTCINLPEEFATIDVERQIGVRVNPYFEHKLTYLTQTDLYLQSLEKTNQKEVFSKIEGSDEITSAVGEKIQPIVERINDPYEINTEYTVTIYYKKLNLFNLIQPKTTIMTFKTGESEEDEYESRASKLISTISSRPPKEAIQEMQEQEKKCPVFTIRFDAPEGNFKIKLVNCPFATYTDEDLGEDVTVEIYTSDFEQGKQAFRDWLVENGLQESDKLRVEYIHKPK